MMAAIRPPVWTAGPILEAVQAARLFNDSKDFVDCPLHVDPDECWRRWDELQQPVAPAALEAFVASTFGPPGGGLEPWSPPDHTSEPPLLARLVEPELSWARHLNDLWPVLGRRVSAETLAAPQRTSLLAARHGFVIPGGRFREAYYWDSYWVLLGLLAVGMRTTARSVADNLLDAVEQYGFVPNGLRSYYLNRSQPPMLTQMVHALAASLGCPSGPDVDLFDAAEAQPEQELELLQRALPLLDKEYNWWMGEGSISVIHLPAVNGSSQPPAVLNRYAVNETLPRPESWREDRETAAGLPAEEAARLFAQLAAGAETGWDYSSRWLRSDGTGGGSAPPPLQGIQTSELLAVDLNSILYKNEKSLAALHSRLAALLPAGSEESKREGEAAEAYTRAAGARQQAMRAYMWDASSSRWHDVLWRSHQKAGELTAAAFTPLWAGLHSAEEAAGAVASLRASGLLQRGGIATSLLASGQQWDFPNAWPPLQEMLITGLRECGVPEGKELALELADLWLASNLKGWVEDGVMHEKYDATRPGKRGEGGEYVPQVGFGWTNGVALSLLRRYRGLSGAATAS